MQEPRHPADRVRHRRRQCPDSVLYVHTLRQGTTVIPRWPSATPRETDRGVDLGICLLSPGYVLNNGSAIIVSVCGTNALSYASIAVDMDYTPTAPDSTYFPNLSGAKLHHGFYSAFTRIAPGVATGVQSGLDAGITDVIVIGHSLGWYWKFIKTHRVDTS